MFNEFILCKAISGQDSLTYETFHLLDTLRQFFHIAAHFLRCDFGVDLRRADAAVSQHLRECFNRHVVRQAYGRRVGVAAHVPRDVFLDTALSRRLHSCPGRRSSDRLG